MAKRDRELDHLATDLEACLGRIDRELESFLADLAGDEERLHHALDGEAAKLHDLIGSVVEAAHRGDEHADLDRVVAHAIEVLVQEARQPLVVRSKLAGNLPRASCRTADLLPAVQRALGLAAAHAGPAGAVGVRTVANGPDVEVCIEAEDGGSQDPHLRERALTLQAFVVGWHGQCRIDTTGGRLALAITLPVAQPADNG